MPFAANNTPVRNRTLVRGFGVLSILAGSVFLMYGGTHAIEEQTRLTNWPAAEARVEECALHGYHTFRSHVQGMSEQVRCSFQFEIDGVSHQAVKDAGSRVFSSPRQVVLVPGKVTREGLLRWIAAHPKGSTQTIHYNPANPQEIFLGGADDDIQENTSAIQLKIGGTLLAFGAILFGASFAIRRRAAIPATFPSTPPSA